MALFWSLGGWLINSMIGRALVASLALTGVYQYVKHQGVKEERARVVQAGQVNATKANKVRAKVERTPESKLSDKYVRD